MGQEFMYLYIQTESYTSLPKIITTSNIFKQLEYMFDRSLQALFLNNPFFLIVGLLPIPLSTGNISTCQVVGKFHKPPSIHRDKAP